MRCVYLDLDGTLLGPDASLLTAADGRFSLLGVRALEACARAGVEVAIYSGRRQSSVFESARLLGCSSYVFELGAGLVLDGELEWLTDGVVPSTERGSIYDQIEASGAPALLLSRFAGQLEYHTPWSAQRDVSHLFRGRVDLHEVAEFLSAHGLDWLRLVDNGVVRAAGERPVLEAVPAAARVQGSAAGGGPEGAGSGAPPAGAGLEGAGSGAPPAVAGTEGADSGAPSAGVAGRVPVPPAHAPTPAGAPTAVQAYHLIPAGASKARGVARHMQARGLTPGDCIAVGDSREDMDTAGVVGTFWLVANALVRDPTLESEIAGRPGIRLASESYGAGVYEAVVTTLAEHR